MYQESSLPIDLVTVDTGVYERLLAISDIHGDLQALDALLQAVGVTENDMLVTLGDYVDRGHFTAQVIDRLIALHKGENVFSLRGNHDQWMIDARQSKADLEFWLTIAGSATLASYEEETIDAVPDTHWGFLVDTCVDIVETEEFIFVHGHLEHDVPLELQSADTIQMLQFHNARAHVSGKKVVCGHASTKSGQPEDLGHTIAAETKRWINCIDVRSGQIWRADSSGQTDQTIIL